MTAFRLITIDGPAAAGKGTLARQLADHYNFAHLDTGSLYRGVAHLILQAGDDPQDDALALQAARRLDIHAIDPIAIRSDEVGLAAAQIAAKPAIRAEILTLQRHFAAHPPAGKDGVILDGRDIGTIVCPQAPVKFFITARPEIRAHRRWLDLRHRKPELSEAQVLADLQARDKKDMHRKTAPLKAAEDALLLDTSDLAIEDSLKVALAMIDEKFA